MIRTPTISGGIAPYIISWTMNRPILCDVITTSGDEIFTSTSCADNTCLSGINAPVCFGNMLTTKLIDTAMIYVTVTDANGCIAVDSFMINAEDVRCFAGKSGVAKVKVCHMTSSAKNPCVSICIDESAVNAHLTEHGDYVGKCNATCTPPVAGKESDGDFGHMVVYPNPAERDYVIELHEHSEKENQEVTIEIFDNTGKLVAMHTTYMEEGLLLESIAIHPSITNGVYVIRAKVEGNVFYERVVISR